MTISSVSIQLPIFMKRTETHLIGLQAKFLWRKLVLYNKNGLACLKEWKELIALLIGKAFFVGNYLPAVIARRQEPPKQSPHRPGDCFAAFGGSQ